VAIGCRAAYAWVGRASIRARFHRRLGAPQPLHDLHGSPRRFRPVRRRSNLSRRNGSTTCLGNRHRRRVVPWRACARDCGITPTAKVQVVLTLLELGRFDPGQRLAIWNARAAPAEPFSCDWFFPSAFGTFDSFLRRDADHDLLLFRLGRGVQPHAEETANAKKAAGLGGVVGVFVIVALFLLAQVAIQMALTSDQIPANAANLLPASAMWHSARLGARSPCSL